MKSILVFYPNYGAGIGSCLISFSVLLEIAKFLNIDFAIDWSQRAQLKNKEICIFDKLLSYPNKIKDTNIFFGNNIHDKMTKKGNLIKPFELFNIERNDKIYVVRDSCSEHLLKEFSFDADKILKENLMHLDFKFDTEKLRTLDKI